jgi:hypothetical protein
VIEPRHKFESVVKELREGLQSGSIVLDRATPAPPPDADPLVVGPGSIVAAGAPSEFVTVSLDDLLMTIAKVVQDGYAEISLNTATDEKVLVRLDRQGGIVRVDGRDTEARSGRLGQRSLGGVS